MTSATESQMQYLSKLVEAFKAKYATFAQQEAMRSRPDAKMIESYKTWAAIELKFELSKEEASKLIELLKSARSHDEEAIAKFFGVFIDEDGYASFEHPELLKLKEKHAAIAAIKNPFEIGEPGTRLETVSREDAIERAKAKGAVTMTTLGEFSTVVPSFDDARQLILVDGEWFAVQKLEM